ncbi:MAG TPA: dolichyl-phosphate beta-glucosyltransferase [Gemmataceae bacterium]|jgi:dolichyl-phosphate beta-glucosyltransferase
MVDIPCLSLILPAYNEAGRIRQTIEQTRSYLEAKRISHEIIVAADGDDGTREIVAEMANSDPRLSVLGGVERRGKGRGIRLGVERATGQVIGFADADFKTPIEELNRLLPWFGKGYDIVMGSRRLAESRIETPQPLHRQLGSRAFALTVHLLLGMWNIHDTQCGFKFFRAPVARDLFGRQRIDGYMFDVEVLHLAERSGYHVKEVGVRWRDDGDSRSHLMAINWQNLLDILRIRFGKTGSPAPGAGEPQDDGARRLASCVQTNEVLSEAEA